ncbi:hypothetical protein [Rhizobium sp. BK176]|uniref:hypothetical protein n=1 Tax=Rhizobium sp. BK176 TaxID=2587071 RepID=UPI002167CB50|nr:hypothetical protein [Rhizobium sp. BK176]MCS4089723.1 hypothetical protein [Rhizobium sp. BK176]
MPGLGNHKLFRISHRSAGQWALFSMWLCVVFAITYGQAAFARSATATYMMLAKWPASPGPDAVVFQFHDEVGLYAANAALLLASLLIIAVFKAGYRFALMGFSVVGAAALALGLLEKMVYHKWIASNDTLLMAEEVRRMPQTASLDLGSWAFDLSALSSLDPMMIVDLAVILGSAVWAVICWKVAKGKAAAFHGKEAAA